MKSYSIRQAADALGVTKQSIRYHLKKSGVSLVKDDRGLNVIPEEVFEEIRGKIGSKETGKEAANNTPFTGKEKVNEELFPGKEGGNSGKFAGKEVVNDDSFTGKEVNDALLLTLSMLRDQIAVKDAQIASLTSQLSDVTEALKSAQKALEGAQALHAATVHQLQEAKQEAATTRTEDVEAAPDDSSPSPSDDAGTRAPDPEDGNPVVPDPPKRSLWSRLFGRRT